MVAVNGISSLMHCFCPLPASPHCPKDGVYHSESSCCFQIVPTELSWTDARQQCSARGGDLALVRTDALRNLLAPKVTQWVFLSLSSAEIRPPSDSRPIVLDYSNQLKKEANKHFLQLHMYYLLCALVLWLTLLGCCFFRILLPAFWCEWIMATAVIVNSLFTTRICLIPQSEWKYVHPALCWSERPAMFSV